MWRRLAELFAAPRLASVRSICTLDSYKYRFVKAVQLHRAAKSLVLSIGAAARRECQAIFLLRMDHGQGTWQFEPARRVGRRSCRRPRVLCGVAPPALERVVRLRGGHRACRRILLTTYDRLGDVSQLPIDRAAVSRIMVSATSLRSAQPAALAARSRKRVVRALRFPPPRR
jgi:hypothetical protein